MLLEENSFLLVITQCSLPCYTNFYKKYMKIFCIFNTQIAVGTFTFPPEFCKTEEFRIGITLLENSIELKDFQSVELIVTDHISFIFRLHIYSGFRSRKF